MNSANLTEYNTGDEGWYQIEARAKLPDAPTLPFSHVQEILAGHPFNISINTDSAKCRQLKAV